VRDAAVGKTGAADEEQVTGAEISSWPSPTRRMVLERTSQMIIRSWAAPE
jgi:hypothetical protein